MAGLIRREDIDEVRSRTHIEDVVGQYVTLKSAGVGSMKGLCPFHDERTPSFHVRPQLGFYHCFGCGEGGDVISFLQKIEQISFTEAVQRLADKLGYTLRYEDGHGPAPEERGRRARLLEAHRVAHAFFREQLAGEAAAHAREFMAGKGFDGAALERFGVGFAPAGWDHLLRHLRTKGFRDQEIELTGLVSRGQRGLYDRFRGRLTWPIKDITGEIVGFGARKLDAEEQGPKYLNTPETPLYHKSQVLYGLDVAKRQIARTKRVVVVEGYTDVMACHLAGVPQAVATCGTAFGDGHVKVVRRLLSDDDAMTGEVIFTFDGDEAGQKAALRAYGEDQKFVAQTYVAVQPDGMDPNELWQARGDEAVRALVDGRKPLFEFVIRSTLKKYDLDTVEGRVQALRATAPLVGGIRDRSMRPAYARQLAKWLGSDVGEVSRAVEWSARHPRSAGTDRRDGGRRDGDRDASRGTGPGGPRPGRPGPAFDSSDPVVRVERGALQVALQMPRVADEAGFGRITAESFTVPAHRAVFDAVLAAGGISAATDLDPARWAESVREAAASTVAGLVTELAVQPVPADGRDQVQRYAHGVVARVEELGITRRRGELLGKLQRTEDDDPDATRGLLEELNALELRRRELRVAEG